MKQKIQHFMIGRYGADQLGRFLMGLSILFLLISLITRLDIFYVFALGLMAYEYYRMMSRKADRRYAENQKYLNARYRLVVKWNHTREHLRQRRIYRFYRCPSCKQKVRVPKGKGRICITCPKCKEEFVKKS